MNTPIISVRNLTKSYRLYSRPSDRLKESLWPWRQRHTLFHALQDVSFDVLKGQHLGVIGVNGAGKSTLLQILTGVLTPSGGAVEVRGRVAALLELGAGFNPELTGRENVRFLTSILEDYRGSAESLLHDIMDFAEIGAFIDQPVKTYSSGMFARLAFAMNISLVPDILIVDEALAVGDAFFQQKCLRRMKAYRGQGTILFVSHDTSAVAELCDNALWLDQGRVREYGPSKEVCEHYLASSYTSGFAEPEAIREAIREERGDPPAASFSENPAPDETIRRNLAELRETLVSDFADKDSFGDGGAVILRCAMENKTNGLSTFSSGSLCRMTVYFHCKRDISSVIVGFIFKDRLGKAIYGTNSYRYHQNWSCKAGEIYAATFEYVFPDLLPGEYFLTLAVAEGTLQVHRQLQWIYDAETIHFLSEENDGTVVAAKCLSCFLTEGTDSDR